MISVHLHNTVAPCTAAGASIVLGFDLHAVLGIVGQVIGILSGILSIVWVGYQIAQARKQR